MLQGGMALHTAGPDPLKCITFHAKNCPLAWMMTQKTLLSYDTCSLWAPAPQLPLLTVPLQESSNKHSSFLRFSPETAGSGMLLSE